METKKLLTICGIVIIVLIAAIGAYSMMTNNSTSNAIANNTSSINNTTNNTTNVSNTTQAIQDTNSKSSSDSVSSDDSVAYDAMDNDIAEQKSLYGDTRTFEKVKESDGSYRLSIYENGENI